MTSPLDLPLCTDFPRDEVLAKEEVSDLCSPAARLSDQRIGGPPAMHRESGLQLSGPKYFLPEIVYAPSDVDPDEVLNVPDSCPSQECLDVDLEVPVEARSAYIRGMWQA